MSYRPLKHALMWTKVKNLLGSIEVMKKSKSFYKFKNVNNFIEINKNIKWPLLRKSRVNKRIIIKSNNNKIKIFFINFKVKL